MYAVVESGGKQYRLSPGNAVNVERIEGEVGQSVTLGRVLMVVDDEGAATIGSPVVDGVCVTAEIVAHGRGRKIVVFKYKPKVNYRRKQGHRQPYTRVRVTAIGAPPEAPTPERRSGKAAAKEPTAETPAVAEGQNAVEAEATKGGEA
jgi:large subunit ribosomal protein L21